MTTNLTKIDFNQLKESFKDFLRQKPEFMDYDFNGSGFSYLLDLLTYNTATNAFYLNMVSNEMFLDSAQMKANVLSKAKLLGYLPQSAKCSRATIHIEYIFEVGSDIPSQIYIPLDTSFMGVSGSNSYEFVVSEARTLYKSNPDGSESDYNPETNRFFTDIEIIEGVRLTQTYTVLPDINQRFIIPNENADTSSIRVWIQESPTKLGLTPFTFINDITEVEASSKVFYKQYTENGLCEIYFGDGIISAGFRIDSENNVISNGVAPGNIVIIEYIVSRGRANANGIKEFTATGDVGTSDPAFSSTIITTVLQASDGQEFENNKTIKYYAPINYEMQNRAVTELDFQQLILKKYPKIDAIAVWGGEENIPVHYGKVFISIKPSEGYILNNEDKDYIISSIRPRCVVTQDPVIVDPDYLYIEILSDVKYDFRRSPKRKQEVQNAVYQMIVNYGSTELEKFGKGFIYSDLVSRIDDVDAGIYSNITTVSLKKIIYPTLGIKETYELNFANKFDMTNISDNIYNKAIFSSQFYYGDSTACILAEDSFGSAILSLFKVSKNNTLTKIKEFGSIDAASGIVSIKELFVPSAWINNVNQVEFYVNPAEYDINSSRNLILIIDQQDVHVTIGNKSL